MKHILYLFLLSVLFFTSCSVSAPEEFVPLQTQPDIYPDYKGTVIPFNIAPLNFRIEEEGEKFITIIKSEKGTLAVKGKKAQFNEKKWKQLLLQNKGNTLTWEVYVFKNKKWHQYAAFSNQVTAEPIDEYLSYRLIQPSYVYYEELSIEQRNLTNFDTKDIYNNQLTGEGNRMQCINCHAYQNYKTDNMQFHMRGIHAGTMLVVDGDVKKVNLKNDKTISAGVYPAWHPTEKLIAYSVNQTYQRFHFNDIEKVEVQDLLSDLILYNVETNEVSVIQDDPDQLENFPAWSPDGKMLYYVSARLAGDNEQRNMETMTNHTGIKYNIMRIPFNIQTHEFGQPEVVFDASAIGKSATLARISPNGRYLLFTLGDYGKFHIWHKSSDLHIIDLQTGAERKLENVNSPDVESYHTWSSNGRWIVFSSRRDDGSYTRPYFAYFSAEGKAFKPFMLPQKDPDFYQEFYKSFNIPEFMTEPVKISAHEFAKAAKKEAIPAQ